MKCPRCEYPLFETKKPEKVYRCLKCRCRWVKDDPGYRQVDDEVIEDGREAVDEDP